MATARLTPREREVLALLAAGLSCRQVARSLWLSHKTVEHHAMTARARLRARSTANAVAVALEAGLFTAAERAAICRRTAADPAADERTVSRGALGLGYQHVR